MRAMTPTPPQQRRDLEPATPEPKTDLSPAISSANTKTIATHPKEISPTLQLTRTTQDSSPPSDLIVENTALKKELAELRKEMQIILNHSIESDQRLIQYTEDVFLPPKSMTESTPLTPTCRFSNKIIQTECLPNEDLTSARNTVHTLEQQISMLSRPCESCVILKDETKKMIESLRCLEAENNQLKCNLLNSPPLPQISTFTQSRPPLTLHNSFDPLSRGGDCEEGPGFMTIRRKEKKKSRYSKTQQSTNNQEKKNVNRNKIVNASTEKQTVIPFKNVTILGDSHVRKLAALVGDKVRPGPKISGVCKPGAGIRSVKPTSTPPPSHCYVVMAGTNDVEAGRENIIFPHIEEVLRSCVKSSRVLIIPLTTRYDLHPKSVVHRTVNLVNGYIANFCSRHHGVEMLDIGSIARQHYTTHGLHLRERGKRLLAGLIVERMACMTTINHHHRRTPAPTPATVTTSTTPPAPIVLPYETYAEAASKSNPSNSLTRPRPAAAIPSVPPAPFTLPYETYAEAAAQSTSSYHLPGQQRPNKVTVGTDSLTSVFLDKATLTTGQN